MKLVLRNSLIFLSVCLLIILGLNVVPSAQTPNQFKIQPPAPPEISGGAAMSRMRISFSGAVDEVEPIISYNLESSSLITFDAVDFNSDQANQSSGFFHIPPDCHGAAGANQVVNVVNTSIEWYDKSGTQQNSQSLNSFFAPLNPVNDTFDPKVIYDQYADRFVVVTLEIQDTVSAPTNSSRILLAVSDDSNPAGTWYYYAINSLETFLNPNLQQVLGHWADYPGFAVDEEVVYVTCNMFTFGPTPTNGGVRLWIIKKGIGMNGFYDGGTATSNIYSPYDSTSGSLATTTQPAHMFGPAPTIGTFLVSYSGLSAAGNESVQIIRVDDPAGTPTFHHQFVPVGDIDNTALGLPDAPQMGSGEEIETNDRRALNAVWRNNYLWMCATILPGSGTDAFQATAHWWKLNASTPNSITVGDQGNAGGEDVAAQTHTFFPSVMVDKDNNMCLGFSACGQNIFPGAYYAARLAGDPPGTIQATQPLRAGVDFYVRRFGGALNRWGDYSGIALDPSDETTFWIYNEYAKSRGTVIPPSADDGRWATGWGDFSFTAQAPANINVNPLSFIFNVGIGGTASDNLTIQNTASAGSQDLNWGITYQKTNIPLKIEPVFEGNKETIKQDLFSANSSMVEAPFSDNSGSNRTVNNTQNVSLILDDGTPENNIGLTNGGQFVWLNRFTPNPADFPFNLEEVHVLFSNGVGINVGELVDIYIYEDTDGDGDPGTGTNFLGKLNGAQVQFTDNATFSVYPISPVTLNGPGDVIIAVVNRTAGIAAGTFVAAIDQTTTAMRSWIGTYTQGNPSDPPTFPGDGLWGMVDGFGFAGNWLVRGFGTTGGGACSWLTVNPTSGTTAPGGSDNVSIGVDATGLTQGTYNCTLTVASNDPNDPTVDVPIELNVGPVSIDDDLANQIEGFQLYQNYPNPFNPSTEISYQLAVGSEVELTIYNSLGQQVRQLVNEQQSAGEKRIEWNGLDDSGQSVSSGVYLYHLRAGKFSSVKKMVLMR